MGAPQGVRALVATGTSPGEERLREPPARVAEAVHHDADHDTTQDAEDDTTADDADSYGAHSTSDDAIPFSELMRRLQEEQRPGNRER